MGEEVGLKFVAKDLYEIMQNNDCEYIDFMCFGFDYQIILDAGFKEVDIESEELIIPNHFSPFVQKNIKLHFFVDTDKVSNIKICKADGDQDRPS